MVKENITLRIICNNPPSTHTASKFGLQNKAQELVEGEPLAENRLQFTFEMTVQQKEGKLNFTGQFAHGTLKERFVYLTLKALQADEWQIVRRAKIQLKTITWEQVETVLANPHAYLQAEVDARGTGTVPLLCEGWLVRTQ
jgi:TusA-related sulfurtransferase